MKAVKAPMTKSQLIQAIADETDVAKKDVASVLAALPEAIEAHIKPRAAGKFTLPGLLKITVVQKPARPAKKGVPNPFRPGELMDVAAKPATKKVKLTALKALKDMV